MQLQLLRHLQQPDLLMQPRQQLRCYVATQLLLHAPLLLHHLLGFQLQQGQQHHLQRSQQTELSTAGQKHTTAVGTQLLLLLCLQPQPCQHQPHKLQLQTLKLRDQVQAGHWLVLRHHLQLPPRQHCRRLCDQPGA